jgi:regulator of sigma E protease
LFFIGETYTTSLKESISIFLFFKLVALNYTKDNCNVNDILGMVIKNCIKEIIMQKLLKIAFYLLILSFVICFHEMGHFVACKIFSMRTPVFSIGFGTPIVQKKIGQTTFQIALLPLGGYVSINATDLAKAAYWQKMIITLAGIFNNFLLAYFLLILIFFFNRTRFKPIIRRLKKGSPAAQAQLQPGDRIVRINTILIDSNTELLLQTIQAHPEEEITLTIDRNGTIIDVPLKLSMLGIPGGSIGYAGIVLEKDLTQKISLYTIAKQALSTLLGLMQKTFFLITGIFKPKRNSTNPMNLAFLAQKNLQKKISLVLFFIALISIELGVFNVLPIPMLDGGQAVFYTLEALTGGISETIINLIYVVLLIIFVLYLNRRQQHKNEFSS